MQPGNIFYSYGSLTLCHYASRIEPYAEADDEPSLHLYRLLRSLSEKSRLRILHFLRSAGLLNVHVVGETVSTYSLRVERVQQIEQGLFDYLGMPPSLLSNSVNEME
ncbi:hypothetical protein ACFW1P_06285 [Paenibacillus sp. NPDC058910]|uniref:hypothetical protein n=1 Tax=unclassified Paenibacillus TaxID=185978 RepID=UPI0036CE2EA2